MRWASSTWLALAGCNQILGNRAAVLDDAAFYDAHLDAPTTCTSLPSFARSFVQVISQNCASYSFSPISGDAAAMCVELGNGRTIELGKRDAPLAIDPTITVEVYATGGGVRMSADGTRLTLGVNVDTGKFAAATLHREAGTWVRDPDIVGSLPSPIHSVSEVTLGGRVLVAYDVHDIRELEHQGNAWVEVARDVVAGVGGGVHLSSDGLRNWGSALDGVELFSRPNVESPFVPVGIMPGTNGINDSFLTDDCGALYFSALASVWVAPRSS